MSPVRRVCTKLGQPSSGRLFRRSKQLRPYDNSLIKIHAKVLSPSLVLLNIHGILFTIHFADRSSAVPVSTI